MCRLLVGRNAREYFRGTRRARLPGNARAFWFLPRLGALVRAAPAPIHANSSGVIAPSLPGTLVKRKYLFDSMMIHRVLLLALGVSLWPIGVSADDPPENVTALLEPIRAQHRAPALAAAAMINGKLAAVGATGLRKSGGNERVTEHDLWHIGSCTKSMTASLAAVLVQEGKLRWESTVSEVFPNLRGRLHDSWASVTLEQLLVNRAGAPGDAPKDLWSAAWKHRGSAQTERMNFVTGLISRPTEAPPGEKYIYSN